MVIGGPEFQLRVSTSSRPPQRTSAAARAPTRHRPHASEISLRFHGGRSGLFEASAPVRGKDQTRKDSSTVQSTAVQKDAVLRVRPQAQDTDDRVGWPAVGVLSGRSESKGAPHRPLVSPGLQSPQVRPALSGAGAPHRSAAVRPTSAGWRLYTNACACMTTERRATVAESRVASGDVGQVRVAAVVRRARMMCCFFRSARADVESVRIGSESSASALARNRRKRKA